ncbi:hypothetical protein MTR67_051910 [Solanum verrucosum]|uniref:Uncharacterized protein n=1 Tax=Solanum verrucosum TaxID=315347 RepID=A0AAF0V4U4_SOLVR|nr:hypothetical protein MTR67_051910 [Solanum verrucosum]
MASHVGSGARSENNHTYKTIGSLVICLCRFLRAKLHGLFTFDAASLEGDIQTTVQSCCTLEQQELLHELA